MRVLIVTKIFPNRNVPSESSYNRHQFRELSKLCDVELVVLQPWYPGVRMVSRMRGYALDPELPARDVIDGLDVQNTRVLYIPKLGALAGGTYTLSLLSTVLPRRGRIDVVLGSFAFPDGWAAVALARLLGCPAVVKLHGSDINTNARYVTLRPGLRFALSGAKRVVGNSEKLLAKAVRFGADPERTRLVRNGIDKQLFFPRPRAEARRKLGLPVEGKRILFVGRPSEAKGMRELLDAMEQLVAQAIDVHLDVVGDCPERKTFARAAEERGLPVTFHGRLSAEQVAEWQGAADIMTLPSWAEGTPNSVIEALASGRPVVATDVGGIPSLISAPCQGELVPRKDPAALAAALARVLDANYAAEDVAAAQPFPDWHQSAAALHQALSEAHLEYAR